jgi:hypothetical protein
MRRLNAASISATAIVLLLAATAAAKSPHAVDPATVTPPLNPDFTWSCFDTGSGPTCQGTWEHSYANEPIDMTCDGSPVYVTGTGSERVTRSHLSDGRATKTITNLSYPEDRLGLSPTGDGQSVIVRGHWNRHYTYPVPGDRSTRVLTEVGAVYVATAPGEGLVFHDVGLVRFQPGADFEGIDVTRGPHDLYAHFAAVKRAVCDQLR